MRAFKIFEQRVFSERGCRFPGIPQSSMPGKHLRVATRLPATEYRLGAAIPGAGGFGFFGGLKKML